MGLQIASFTQDQSYPASWLRMAQAASATPGVVHNGDMTVSPSSGLGVSVSSGLAYIPQTVATEGSFYQGTYFAFNDAVASPYNSITAPLSNNRIDLVVARVYDVFEQSLSGSSKAQFEWVQGSETAGASLTNLSGAPATPANTLLLAYVLQTPGETSIPSGNILNVANRSLSPLAGNSLPSVINSNASFTATPWTMQVVTNTNPVTVTLPPPIQSMRVGVRNGVSGGGNVTIAASSGTTISGVGSLGVSSIPLSMAGATIEFLYDSVYSTWQIVAGGQQDTGWMPLTLINGATANGPYPPSCRVQGDTVRLKGEFALGSTAYFANIPAAARPAIGSNQIYSPAAGISATQSGDFIYVCGPSFTPANQYCVGNSAIANWALDGGGYSLS